MAWGKRLTVAGALVLALMVSFSMADSDGAEALSEMQGDYEFGYSEFSSNASILRYTGTDSAVTLPVSVTIGSRTYPVTSVGESAFEGNTSLQSISVPNTYVEIGSYAFRGCTSLSSVGLSGNLSVMGRGVFENCDHLLNILVPGKVSVLGEGTFRGCTALGSAELVGVRSIGTSAFSGCTTLSDVTLATVLETIGNNAFSGCTGMTHIELPSSLKKIDYGAFSGCDRLTEITIPEKVVQIGDRAFSGCSALGEVDILNESFSDSMVREASFDTGRSDINANCVSAQFTGTIGFGSTVVALNETEFTATFTNCTLSPKTLKTGDSLDFGSELEGTKPGYSFSGWAENYALMPAKDVTLTAVWVPGTYAVTMNANGGIGADVIQNHTNGGSDCLVPNTFDHETSKFIGWSKTPGGAKYMDDSQQIPTLTEDLMLYAMWDPLPYSLVFDGNHGTGSMYGEAFESDVPKALRTNSFVRTGYDFLGWSGTADGDVVYTDGQSVTNPPYGRLYAVWSPIQYTVKFDMNGGTGSVNDLSVIYGGGAEVPGYSVIRTGYDFLGWYCNETKATYSVGDDISTLVPYPATVTLRAVWDPHHYTVRFHKNAGETEQTFSQEMIYGVQTSLNANPFGYLYHDFSGWAESPDGAVKYADRQKVSNLSAVDGDVIDLYAIWVIGSYLVVFDPGDGEGTMPRAEVKYFEEFTIPECSFTYSDHVFKEWNVIYASGETEVYLPGDTVVNLYHGNGDLEAVILNAVWEEAPPEPGKSDSELPSWVMYATVAVALVIAGIAFAYWRFRF